MRTFLASMAIAAAFASPALAQTTHHLYQSPYAQYDPNGRQMYIYPPDNHVHSSNPANDVYDIRGRYLGSDPDPFIRDSLARGRSSD